MDSTLGYIRSNSGSFSRTLLYAEEKKCYFEKESFPFLAILIASVMIIFSNSMLSHDSAATFLPSVAIAVDWLHFKVDSAWVGGIFYTSLILMFVIRNERVKEGVYDLSLALARFSLLATFSLGIIGLTGVYTAWIQLHSLDSLFNTQY